MIGNSGTRRSDENSPDLLHIAGISPSSNDHTDGTIWSLVGASYQAPGGVVEDGTHSDLHVGITGDGLLKESSNVLTFDSRADETFGPAGKIRTG